jgi:hypothetical protein
MKMVVLFQMNRAVVTFVVVCGAVLSANARLTEVFTWNQVGPRPQSSLFAADPY